VDPNPKESQGFGRIRIRKWQEQKQILNPNPKEMNSDLPNWVSVHTTQQYAAIF
jgi:hypothetical protein